ncbi:hypothetical protein BD410DRAFT_427416 [Rickenella mellea]|uniref:Uncharacterized protein n=1 Tax=Rickenella mellea TaxID=50990 RepID=A0A4Y7QK09_9AGAM|nr:hypothetical protein BD410DRAFT_427416 [Rickenella mellea]
MAVATQGPPMRLRCRMQYGPSKTRLLQTLENHAAIAMVRQDIARVGIPLPKTVNIEIVHREFRGPVVDFFWDTFRHSLSYQARNALENFNNPSSSHKELLNLEKISTWIDRRARSDTPSASESPVIHPAVLPAAPLPTRPYTSTTISQILSAAVPALQITPITDVTVPLDATHGSNETPVTQPPSDPDTSNVTGPSNFLVSTPITTSNTKPVATTSCGVSPRMPSDANGDMVAKSLSRFSPAIPRQSAHIPPETSAMTNGSSCQPDCSSPPRDPCTITAPALPPVLQSDPSNRVIETLQSCQRPKNCPSMMLQVTSLLNYSPVALNLGHSTLLVTSGQRSDPGSAFLR